MLLLRYVFCIAACPHIHRLTICFPATQTGEVCLDLLKTAWTPAYTIATTIDAIWQMLDSPGVDSPLNVDVAALLREGDSVGAEGLVRWCCGEWKWEGK
jgi:peroxin-4